MQNGYRYCAIGGQTPGGDMTATLPGDQLFPPTPDPPPPPPADPDAPALSNKPMLMLVSLAIGSVSYLRQCIQVMF